MIDCVRETRLGAKISQTSSEGRERKCVRLRQHCIYILLVFIFLLRMKMVLAPIILSLRPRILPCLSSINLVHRQTLSRPRLCQRGDDLPVLRPSVHPLTPNYQQLPQLHQRRQIHRFPFLLSNLQLKYVPLSCLHFRITFTAPRHKSCQSITSPNVVEIFIRLEYERFKGTSRSLGKRS